MKSARIAVIMSILILSSIAVSADTNTSEFDGRWVLADARAPEPIREGTLTITGTSFTGTTACNSYSGTYSFDEEGLVSIDGVTTTLRACIEPDLNTDESRYIEAFTNIRMMGITSEGMLLLRGVRDDGHLIILRYERVEDDAPSIGVVGVRTSATVEPRAEAELSFVVADRRSEGEPVQYFLEYGGNEYVRMSAIPIEFSLGPGERETITVTASSANIGRYTFDVSVHELALVGTPEQEALATQTLSLSVHEEITVGELDGSWRYLNNTPHHPYSPVSIHIDGNRFNGQATCNRYNGTLSLGEGTITITSLTVGESSCIVHGFDMMAQEQHYLTRLEAVTAYRIESNTLFLSGPEGELRFEEDAPIASSLVRTMASIKRWVEAEPEIVIGTRSITIPDHDATFSFDVMDTRTSGPRRTYSVDHVGSHDLAIRAEQMQFSLGPRERETITIRASSADLGSFDLTVFVRDETRVDNEGIGTPAIVQEFELVVQEPEAYVPPRPQPINDSPPSLLPVDLYGYYTNEDRTAGGLLSVEHDRRQGGVRIVLGTERYDGILTRDQQTRTFSITTRCAERECPQMRGRMHSYETISLYEGEFVFEGSTYLFSLFAPQESWQQSTQGITVPMPEQRIEDETYVEPQITFHGVERARIFGFIPNPFAQPLASFSVRTQSGSEQRQASIGSTIEIEGHRYQVYDDRIEPITG